MQQDASLSPGVQLGFLPTAAFLACFSELVLELQSMTFSATPAKCVHVHSLALKLPDVVFSLLYSATPQNKAATCRTTAFWE